MEHDLRWFLELQWAYHQPSLIFIPAAFFTALSVLVFRRRRSFGRSPWIVSAVAACLWFLYSAHEFRVYQFFKREGGVPVRFDMLVILLVLYLASLGAISL